MLRFNTFRASRYLRSKFVEGKYLLASEATDLELEILDLLRQNVQSYLGDIAIEDAWKVERLNATQILIKPGEAWFKGLPFVMRSGKDQLVSGAILSLGTVPVGVTSSDDSSGLGKILTFNDAATTPTNLYRLVVTAREELLTEVDDPFLQNANLTEATAQKIRVVFQINIVPESLQTESPVPYRDETSAAGVTNFPNTGGSASPNFVNKIVVTPTAAGNGELISLALVTGSENIDGRDVEIVLRNDSGIGGGNPMPNSPTLQQAFSNGKLIDSNGNKFHINAIFNDVVSTQVVIRLDKEPDQPNPQIINTFPFTLVKREVFVTDDVNGSPQGKLHWPIATLDWSQTDGIIHDSKIVDSRISVSKEETYQKIINQKMDIVLADGGTLSWDLATEMLDWDADFSLINPHGLAQSIPTGSIPLVDGGSAVYEMDMVTGGSIARGTEAINVTVAGATSTLSVVDLSDVRKGNIVVDSGGVVAEITDIDDVNDTITTSPALSNTGAALIYKDSYGPGQAPISINNFVLAVRSGSRIFVGDGLELEDGESSEIGSIPQQVLDYIGSTGETDDSPQYSSNNYVTDGDSLTTAIGDLDAQLGAVSPVASSAGLKLIGGGTISWDIFNQLSFTSDMYLEFKGLLYTDNTIDTASSPIVLPTSLDVAYVIPNVVGGGPLLTPVVDTLDNVPSNAVIIARREGTDVIVGSSSTRLMQGQNTKLYAQTSDETLSYIGATDTVDFDPAYSSDIRGTAGENLTDRAGVLTDAVGDEQEDRSAYWRSDLPVVWTGTDLAFGSDLILEIINTKMGSPSTHTIDTSDSPISLADGESAYVVIDRTQASEILTVILSGVTPIPPQTTPDKDIIILARRQDALGAGYLHIPLHKQVLSPGQSVRLGASGSGSGSGSGSLEPIPGYQWLEVDDFTDLPSSSDSKVVLTDYTNATFDVADTMFALACDKTRTVNTSSGTALTLNLAPGFTVAKGDIVYITSGARSGQWRRIDAVISQTSFTLDAALSGGDASPADTLMVSQAVWTKDLVNYGSVSEKTRARDQFSGDIVQIAIDYFDSLVSGDEIPDYVDSARVVVSASNEGLVSDTGVPLSSEFSPIFTRQPYPTQIDDYILSTNTDQERLHLAFFCNPDNVSVTTLANLLRYETSFFFEENLANGGSLDSSYCYSDASGTEINCTVSTPAGFTEVETDWSYIPNVNPGETKGQLQVFVDGLEIPRKVVGSTLDAYYEEVQNAVTGVYDTIRFHTDLSGTPLSIEIIKSLGVVDTSNQNTADIADIVQDRMDVHDAGSQDFVFRDMLTAVSSTPAAGQFRTFGILGRSDVPDLANDLGVRYGINRINIERANEILGETGPNGERVWGADNDLFNQIRFVSGNCTNISGADGSYVNMALVGDFMEVVFYGTGLNIMMPFADASRDIRVTVDGGAEGANIWPNAGAGGSVVLTGNRYRNNHILRLASGLSLGLHTVKLRINSATNIGIAGIEVLTSGTTLQVNPGTAVIDGHKYASVGGSPSYASGFTNVYGSVGTKGGRVLMYMDKDGVIHKDIRYTDANALTILNASNPVDHTNEEVVRQHYWREFGPGRTDDFTQNLNGGATDRAGLLDDNTTALAADDVNADQAAVKEVLVIAQSATSKYVLTFVGTGLDLFQAHVTAPGSPFPIVTLDGTVVASGASVPWNTRNWVKIASGLSYGTHILQISQASGSTSLRTSDFRVYAPKKPTLPDGCIELADYCLMSDFNASGMTGTAEDDDLNLPRGVLFKSAYREVIYNGSNSNSLNTAVNPAQYQVTMNQNAFVDYEFYGTGIVLLMNAATGGVYQINVKIDGVNQPGATIVSGGFTDNGSGNYTSTVSGGGTSGRPLRLYLTGLSEGPHKITVTTLSAQASNINGFHIISPVHSQKSTINGVYQNTLPIGSTAISDNREYTPVKENFSKDKGWNQAIGITSAPTTTSTSFVPVPEMNFTFKMAEDGEAEIAFTCDTANSSAGNTNAFAVFVDGIQQSVQHELNLAAANQSTPVSDKFIIPLSKGTHHVMLMWSVSAGTGTANSTRRSIMAKEQ